MPIQLSADDARQSLNEHVAARGAEIRAKFGPAIGWPQLLQILDDRECVRYPCEISFEEEALDPGELAHPLPKGDKPEAGFTLYIHPAFRLQLRELPLLVLYQLVLVNYGEFASPDDAETFGAAVLGLSKDEYYNTLCELSGQIGGDSVDHCEAPSGCQCGG